MPTQMPIDAIQQPSGTPQTPQGTDRLWVWRSGAPVPTTFAAVQAAAPGFQAEIDGGEPGTVTFADEINGGTP